MFDWNRAFINTNVNVFILHKTILNILSHFIPRETLTNDDKEFLWFTKKKKKKSSKRKTMLIKAIERVKATTIHIT